MSPRDQTQPTAPSSPLRRAGIGLLAWGVVLTGGFGLLVTYQMRAGVGASAPDSWPADATLTFDAQRSNLVMFAHPQCPCSAASLEELKVILTRSRGEIAATVCFIDPEGMPAEWTQTSLVRDARAIPGVKVVADRNGAMAEKFGAMTSGQILLFDRQGRRRFLGGITPSRGHAGDNPGRTCVLALAKGEFCDSGQTPVFGCALHESGRTGETTR